MPITECRDFAFEVTGCEKWLCPLDDFGTGRTSAALIAGQGGYWPERQPCRPRYTKTKVRCEQILTMVQVALSLRLIGY